MRVSFPVMSGSNKILVRIVALLIPALCLLACITPSVTAENTYVITDGDQVTVHTSFETNPAEVLSEAGVKLSEDDFYTTAQADGNFEITIQRSQSIQINNCGVLIETTSYGETLDELLGRLGVPAYGDYHVSLPMDTLTYDGMQVTVEYIIETEQTYTVDIPYETTFCEDPTLPQGEEKILVPGVVGQKLCKATAVYVNKEETERTVLEETVISEPVTQIVAVGTNTGEPVSENAPIIGDGFIITADGEMLTFDKAMKFKTTAYTHTDAGCDMITATGTTVRIGAVAVDPKVVPYGTRMFIVSNDGEYIYGIATAEDCGGGIKGNHIDLYFPTEDECWEYGVRSATVYFLT